MRQPGFAVTTVSAPDRTMFATLRSRIERALALTGMGMQSAAAGLAGRRDDLDAVACEDPCGRGVRVAEDAAHDAALEHRDAAAPLSVRRGRRETVRARSVRKQIEEIGHPARETEARRTEERPHPETLRGYRQHREGAENAAVRQEPVERTGPNETLE